MQKNLHPPKEVKQFVKGFYRRLMSIGSAEFYREFCKLYTTDISLKAATSGTLIEKTGFAYLTRIALKRIILEEICAQYNCAAGIIINSNKRGRFTEAKFMYVVLLKQHLNLSLGEIKHIMPLFEKPTISKILTAYSKKINNVKAREDDKHYKVFTAGFFDNMEIVNTCVYNFINKNKNKKP